MVPILLLYNVHIKMKKLFAVKDLAPKQPFDFDDLYRLNR